MAAPTITPTAPTILILAGEPSGDRLGGALMAAIRAQQPQTRFIGVGGDSMTAQGLAPVFPMSDLSVMGLFEVIPAIPRALRHLKTLAQLAQTAKPDLIITIDSQDFAIRLATRTHHLGIPHVHYVAPKVWAWRQGRAAKLGQAYSHLLTILPFEKAFFQKFGLKSTYVGHPAVTTLAPHIQPQPQIPSPAPVLALLPGSRSGELKRHWPIFLQTYRQLRQTAPGLTAVLALPSEKALNTCRTLADWTDADAITPVYGEARFTHLATATAALTKSGTNNLELALLGIPALVTYRMNALTFQIAKRLVKVPFISLPNLILHYAGRPVVYPELIQHAVTPSALQQALTPLLTASPARSAQLKALSSLGSLMHTPQPPATLAAQAALACLKPNPNPKP